MVKSGNVFWSIDRSLEDDFYNDVLIADLERYPVAVFDEDLTSANRAGRDPRRSDVLFTDETFTVGYLYDPVSYELEDKIFWLGLDSFNIALRRQKERLTEKDVEDRKSLKGAYFGRYSSIRYRIVEESDLVWECPVVDGLTREEVEGTVFKVTHTNPSIKGKIRSDLTTSRKQQLIFDSNASSAPVINATGEGLYSLVMDFDNFEGKLQVHHINGDPGDDHPNNLILLPRVGHNLVETMRYNLRVEVVYAIAHQLRVSTHQEIKQAKNNTRQFIEWLNNGSGIDLLEEPTATTSRAMMWFNRFISNAKNNQVYDPADDLWDECNIEVMASIQGIYTSSKIKKNQTRGEFNDQN